MKLIFDIGCNNLKFSEIARVKYPQAKIVCVDANKDFLVTDDRFTVIHAAMYHTDGKMVELYIDDRQKGVSTINEEFMQNSRFRKGSKNLKPNNTQWLRKEKVPTKTLDSLVEEFGVPDVVKVDVEGAEYDVFCGLSQKVGKICWEWSEEFITTIEKCVNRLAELGYEKFGVIGWLDGQVVKGTTHHDSGDAHLIEPEVYHDRDSFLELMNDLCVPERRVLWGMLWAV